MKNKYLFSIIFLLMVISITHSNAQILMPEWSFQIGGAGSDRGLKLMADLNDNIYFAGTIEKDAYVSHNGVKDTITSFGNEDIVFGKINHEGHLVWLKHFGGKGVDSPTDICIYSSNEIFLSGVFEDTLHIETNDLVSQDYIDSFLAKFDSLGNLLWLNHIGGIGNNQCLTMICDANGNLLTGGFFSMTLEFPQENSNVIQSQGGYDGFLAKWSNSGTLLWAKVISCTDNSMIKDIMIDNNNKYYATGTFNGMIMPDSLHGPFYSIGGNDAFITRYNHGGKLIWFKSVGSVFDDNAKCLTLGGNDKIIMTGEFKEDLYFENNKILTSRGGDDIYHLKFNKDGELLHHKKHGKKKNDFVFDAWIPVGQKIMMASDLKVYEENKSITLANYEMLGNLSDTIETSTDFNPLILSAVMSKPDNICFIGAFTDTVIFNQLSLFSVGQEDIFIMKLALQLDSANILKNDSINLAKFPNYKIKENHNDRCSFEAFPNPFIQMTQLTYTLTQTCSVKIEITDMKGVRVKDWQFLNQPAGKYSLDYYGEDLNNGNYQVSLNAVGQTVSLMKVIKLICLN